MSKIVFIAGVLLALLWWARQQARRTSSQAGPAQQSFPNQMNQTDTPVASSQRMVACSQCGLHVLEDDALYRQGLAFCCAEHAARAQTR